MPTGRSLLLLALSLAPATLAGCNSTTEPKPGKPTRIAISAGDGQSGSVGAQLTAPIGGDRELVRVCDLGEVSSLPRSALLSRRV